MDFNGGHGRAWIKCQSPGPADKSIQTFDGNGSYIGYCFRGCMYHDLMKRKRQLEMKLLDITDKLYIQPYIIHKVKLQTEWVSSYTAIYTRIDALESSYHSLKIIFFPQDFPHNDPTVPSSSHLLNRTHQMLSIRGKLLAGRMKYQ